MDEKKETLSQQTEYERDRRKGGLGDWKAIIIALIAGITAIIRPPEPEVLRQRVRQAWILSLI